MQVRSFIALACIGSLASIAFLYVGPADIDASIQAALSSISKRLRLTSDPNTKSNKSDPEWWSNYEVLKKSDEKQAEEAVGAFIERGKLGDPSVQKQIAKFYCDFVGELPVKNAGLVHDKYRTADNCSKVGLPMLRRLAEAGDIEAKFELASYLNSSLRMMNDVILPNDAEAFKWYLDVASNAPSELKSGGLSDMSYKTSAAGWVAKFYKDGMGVSKNLEAAFSWFQVAGDTKQLAEMLAKGEGTAKNTPRAIRLLQPLTDDDHAQYKLAEIFIFYDQTTPDRYEKAKHILEVLHDSARFWYIRHEAAFYLGELYYFGLGMERSHKRAFEYLLEASRYSEAKAQELVATLYLPRLRDSSKQFGGL